MEKFNYSQMYFIDLRVIDGKIVHCWPSKYVNDCLAFHDGKYLGSYFLEPQNPLTKCLQDYASTILHILPTPTYSCFHAEVFHTPNDELIFCEIGCRTGGGGNVEEFRQGFDIDLSKCSVQAQFGLKVEIPVQVLQGQGPRVQLGFIGLPPKQGIFHSAPLGHRVYFDCQTGRSVHRSTSIDYALTLVVKGDTEAQVVQRFQEIADYSEQEMVWTPLETHDLMSE